MYHRPLDFRLGQILVHMGVINNQKVVRARRKQIRQKYVKPLGEILTEMGYITFDDLSRALSLQKDLDTFDYIDVEIE